MLADHRAGVSLGRLTPTLHKQDAWLDAVIDFIFAQLPHWRDDSSRPRVRGETSLTDQFCAYLNSACGLSQGFDTLQFRQEVPDATLDGRRKIDLSASPRGAIIWINGRSYDHYDTLVPIECKRLPTPSGRERREYLHTQKKTTGGVQRFKHGHHGSSSDVGVIIGYIQRDTIQGWLIRLGWWVGSLVRGKIPLWSHADALSLDVHHSRERVAALTSVNARGGSLGPIRLRHLWVEM